MATCDRPTYRISPVVSRYQARHGIPGRIRIIEILGCTETCVCEMSTHGDLLGNILKRGVPLDDAELLTSQGFQGPKPSREEAMELVQLKINGIGIKDDETKQS